MTPWSLVAGDPPRDRLDAIGLVALLVLVAAVQLSIALSSAAVAVLLLAWAAGLAARRERPGIPALFWPLAVYAGLTLVSALLSYDRVESLVDSRQLLLLLVVPATFDLARGRRAHTVLTVVITVGAVSAAIGIFQYGVLHLDWLRNRVHGLLGHYMTYSGLIMLVICAAAARIVFGRRGRTWAALVMPALLVALAVTYSRNAWIGAGAGLAVIFLLRDWRLLFLLPLIAALFLAVAPPKVTARFYSVFDLTDVTNRDRFAMAEAGGRIVRDHPLFGVGPNMVLRVYPEYRTARAVEPNQPHLHNVPLQIAAERGLPALAAWLWFIVTAARLAWMRVRRDANRVLPAAALASLAAMLAAGMFEHNFGDSEFLILLLVLATLPLAAARGAAASRRGGPGDPAATAA